MTPRELREKWAQRLTEWRRFGVSVNGAAIAEEVLADVDQLERDAQLGNVTLKEAHLIGGYSVDRLQKLVASGALENVGRRHRPRIRRAEVPIKPGHSSAALPSEPDATQFVNRRRIVASVTTSNPKNNPREA